VHSQALFFVFLPTALGPKQEAMSYLVLARKWRPLTFDQMVGQEFISRTLKNAVRSGRVAHAFLFTGSRGVGKTSAARILAKCLNCDEGVSPEPCNKCTACTEITEGRSLDVYEIDGASNTSVDDVRELRENIKYMPRPGKRRIYIIDEVHMLSRSAFNALLKTLEEPPEHVIFIFATTEPHKVPDTIQSRCQRYDFRRIPRPRLQERLREMARAEGLTISDAAIGWLVKAADGSMRDAQSLLDQIISYCGVEIPDESVMEILGIAGKALFFRISGAVLDSDPAGCLEALDELYRKGYDVSQFYRDLTEHFRNLLVVRTLSNPATVLDMADAEIEGLKEQAGGASQEDLQRLVSILLRAEGDVLRSAFPRMGLEVTLVRMASLARLSPLAEILDRLKDLEAQGRPGGGPQRAAGPQAPPRGAPAGGRGPAPRPAPPVPSGAGSPPPRGDRPGAGPPPRDAGASKKGEGRGSAPPPTAAPPAPPPRPARAAAGNPEGFIAAVRRERHGLATLLEDVVRWEILPDRVRAFCAEGSFAYRRLRQPDVKDLLTRIAGECFSGAVAFQPCPVGREEPGPGAGPDPGPGPAPREEASPGGRARRDEATEPSPVVQEMLELFRGEITEVKPPETEPEDD